jgi:hypothetical protein
LEAAAVSQQTEWLVGSWFVAWDLGLWKFDRLTTAELDEYERFVNLETIDIYNIITLRVPVPPELLRQSLSSDGDNHNMSRAEQIQEWARNSPLGKADPEKYTRKWKTRTSWFKRRNSIQLILFHWSNAVTVIYANDVHIFFDVSKQMLAGFVVVCSYESVLSG